MIARRSLLLGLASLPAVSVTAHALDAKRLGLKANARGDQSAALRKALRAAADAGKALYIPAGSYQVADIELPDGAQLIGVPGRTRFVATSALGPIFKARNIGRATVSGLVLEGASRLTAKADDMALFAADNVSDLTLDGLSLIKAPGSGVRLSRCGGRLRGLDLDDIANAGIFSIDASGLMIEGCRLSNIGNNGIQVWRSKVEWDGTILRGNHIRRVRADAGGTGQNGNAINLFRAAGVIVSDMQAADCAFSAVRANSCSDVAIRGTIARAMGEIAIYVEFGFSGAVVVGNLIDRAAGGISITNFNEGGRLATVQGNMIRNTFRRPHPETGKPSYGFGIAAEADTAVTGNVVEAAEGQGISLGWGSYLRDVVASGNLIRSAEVGIGVSVVEGAGQATIIGNMISGSQKGAIVGYAWEKAETPDLLETGAAKYRHLTIQQNVAPL